MANTHTCSEELLDDSHLLTVQPGGNYGDQLIYMGFKKRANETNLRFTPLKSGEMRNDTPVEILQPNQDALLGILSQARYLKHRLTTDYDAVYIHGGGNFSEVTARHTHNPIPSDRPPQLGSGIKCFKMVAKIFDCPIIVGPQTCAFDQISPSKIFETVSNKVIFNCREEYSYDLMVDAVAHYETVQVNLTEDMATYLTPNDLPIDRVTEEYSLLAFRNDSESVIPRLDSKIETPLVSRDISKSEPNFKEFVSRVAKASVVHTDRLHVTILSDILGKDVVFYDNSYHKNRAVYKYSFSENPNVSFKKLY